MIRVQSGIVCLFIAVSYAVACSGDTADSESSQASVTAAVGQSCTIPTTDLSVFTGHSATEIWVDDDTPKCGAGVCLVANFEGHPSCPYGQDAGENACTTPSGEPIGAAVAPQLVARPPGDAIYCSCRCDGPGNGDFCACPSGFECRPLIADLGIGGDEYAGSYCVKAGTFIADPTSFGTGPRCDASEANCEDR